MKHSYFNKRIVSIVGATMLSFLPMVAFAVTAPTTFREAAGLFVQIIKGIINILFALLVVGLLYGVVLFFANADNERKRTEIKGYLLWGVIGIIVAFALWGILALLSSSFGWGSAVGIPMIRPPA